MSAIDISIGSKKSILLDTAGKFCKQDILIKNEAYDDFWDAYQQNGQRTDYAAAFGGAGWDDASFAPKYSMTPKTARNMFSWSAISDLPAALEKMGVTIDFSSLNGDGALSLFLQSAAQHIGVVDLSSCTGTNYLFAYCYNLETVDGLIMSDKMTNFYPATNFVGCTALKNITFGGTVPVSISLQDSSMLTEASVNSLITALKDLTGATAQTLTLHADVGAALTEEQKAAITAKNWTLVY